MCAAPVFAKESGISPEDTDERVTRRFGSAPVMLAARDRIRAVAAIGGSSYNEYS
jgi:hypothetical protein